MKLYRTKFIAAAMGVVLHLMGSMACAQGGSSVDPLKDPNSPLAFRSIFFELDSIVVKDEYRKLLKLHADYLGGNPKRRLILQGNTEPRASRETSLAIGGLMAGAVMRVFTELGVSPEKLEAISLGQENAVASPQDEKSLSVNRRVDLVYP
jgi:peptidoglycan-associated lipoprotein